MSGFDPKDPCNPRTRKYLREGLDSLSAEDSPTIRMVKRAQKGITIEGRCVGVLPASFNPPTSAHQALLKEAKRAVRFDELLLVLDQRPMDKELVEAPLEDRLLMLLALFGDDPQISLGISNRGLFLEKVEALQRVYPVDTEIFFIVGYDTIVRVLNPKYYADRETALRQLFSKTRFLVANREERDQGDLRDLLRREENRHLGAQVIPLSLPPSVAWVSSSMVRQKWADGQSVERLIPPRVEEFLKKRGFYCRHDV